MIDPLWEISDCEWTTASFVVRSLLTASEVSPAEFYFILTNLGIEERFRDLYDDHRFFEAAGVLDETSRAVDHKRDGWIAKTGDHAWATGDLDEAKRRYQQSIDARDSSVQAGAGGLLRLHFVQGEYQQCIDVFQKTCPPHEYYEEHERISETESAYLRSTGELPDDWGKAHRSLEKKFRVGRKHGNYSSFFITQAKYMCRAIVTAAMRTKGMDPQLRQMISDYFAIDETQIDQLAAAIITNDNEIRRLQKRVAPKPVVGKRSISDLLQEGDTAMSRRLC